MPAMLAAGGGFLLGVLWMDLLFDVQALGVPADAGVASMASYYRRVTTDASTLHLLIAGVMLLTVAGAVYRMANATAGRRARRTLALLLALVPIGLALGRVVPNAVRLGASGDPPAMQAALAHTICLDHLLCFALMFAFVALMISESMSSRGAPTPPCG